jgi:hypothetical protein
MNNDEFQEGELVIAVCGDRYEVGKIKRLTDGAAFVWYHTGDTAAKTPLGMLHHISNSYVVEASLLNTCHASDDEINQAMSAATYAMSRRSPTLDDSCMTACTLPSLGDCVKASHDNSVDASVSALRQYAVQKALEPKEIK